jgi:hypothetical protein
MAKIELKLSVSGIEISASTTPDLLVAVLQFINSENLLNKIADDTRSSDYHGRAMGTATRTQGLPFFSSAFCVALLGSPKITGWLYGASFDSPGRGSIRR